MYDLQLLAHRVHLTTFRVQFGIVRRSLGPEPILDWRDFQTFESQELALHFFKTKFTSLTGIQWENRMWPFQSNNINKHNRWTIAGIGTPFLWNKNQFARYVP